MFEVRLQVSVGVWNCVSTKYFIIFFHKRVLKTQFHVQFLIQLVEVIKCASVSRRLISCLRSVVVPS
jgi:hypothetical protein